MYNINIILFYLEKWIKSQIFLILISRELHCTGLYAVHFLYQYSIDAVNYLWTI